MLEGLSDLFEPFYYSALRPTMVSSVLFVDFFFSLGSVKTQAEERKKVKNKGLLW